MSRNPLLEAQKRKMEAGRSSQGFTLSHRPIPVQEPIIGPAATQVHPESHESLQEHLPAQSNGLKAEILSQAKDIQSALAAPPRLTKNLDLPLSDQENDYCPARDSDCNAPTDQITETPEKNVSDLSLIVVTTVEEENAGSNAGSSEAPSTEPSYSNEPVNRTKAVGIPEQTISDPIVITSGDAENTDSDSSQSSEPKKTPEPVRGNRVKTQKPKLALLGIADTLKKVPQSQEKRLTIGVETQIYKFVKLEAASQGVNAADIYKAALERPISNEWWRKTFVVPRVTPLSFFKTRHAEDGRIATCITLNTSLYEELEEEQRRLSDTFGEFGPFALNNVVEARILIWALSQQ